MLLAAPSVAGATTFAPAGNLFKATNVGAVTFTGNNGTGVTLQCTASSFVGQVPAAGAHTNNALTGGSVHTTLPAAPTFSGCSVVGISSTVTVKTNTTNGFWGLDVMDFAAATGDAASGDVAALAVPKNSSVTTASNATLGTCTITSPPTGSSSMVGTWKDGTNSTTNPSTLSTKAQIDAKFVGSAANSCAGQAAPVVETGTYAIKDTTNAASAITF